MTRLVADGGGRTAEDLYYLAAAFDRQAATIEVLVQPIVGASNRGVAWSGPNREQFDRDVLTWIRRHTDVSRELRATATAIRRRAQQLEESR